MDLDLWKNPKQHLIVKDVQADYENFLTHIFKMHPQQAKVLSSALPVRFVQALAEEWNRSDYSVVHNYSISPYFVIPECLCREPSFSAMIICRAPHEGDGTGLQPTPCGNDGATVNKLPRRISILRKAANFLPIPTASFVTLTRW